MDLFALDMFGCATTAVLAIFSIAGALAYFDAGEPGGDSEGKHLPADRVAYAPRPAGRG